MTDYSSAGILGVVGEKFLFEYEKDQPCDADISNHQEQLSLFCMKRVGGRCVVCEIPTSGSLKTEVARCGSCTDDPIFPLTVNSQLFCNTNRRYRRAMPGLHSASARCSMPECLTACVKRCRDAVTYMNEMTI